MIADYFVLRRTRLDLRGLYDPAGPCWYSSGFHRAGLAALALGIAPCVPGFLATIEWIEAPEFWTELYHYAWFLSFGVSFVAYLALAARSARTTGDETQADR
jgi:NCS1 family nucleobase:cation symporter-1